MRLKHLIASLSLVAWIAPGAPAGDLGPWVADDGTACVDRYFLVQAAAGVVFAEGDAASGWFATGVAEVDALNQAYGVIAVHRVHRDPPRGRADPARFSELGLDRIYWFELSQPVLDPGAVAQSYDALDAVERAWADAIVANCKTPNDTLWSSQWNLTPEDLHCEPAWDRITDSTVLVSVVDSGGDLDHPDLDANLWVNGGEIPNNGIDDEGNGHVDDVHGFDFWNGDGKPDDDYGHGSHVSGVIGAEGNNGRDIAGICWSATLQMVKVLSQNGTGTWTTISQGIVYAADNGASVANYSLGGSIGDPSVDSAVQYAAGLDVVQVAAAGNSGSNVPFYPAAYDGVIAVMATDISEKRAAWSNYGDWCDLCAPGDGVTSLWKGGLTAILSGTSQSAPHVAGVAAIVRTLNPRFDRIDVELLIEQSAKDLGLPGPDSTFQWGIAELDEAVIRAISLDVSATTIPISGTVDLFVDCADLPGDVYIVLPSFSGREPGIDLSPHFSNEYRFVPANYDTIMELSLLLPNVGVFNRFIGALDSGGQASATLDPPTGKLFSGKTVSFSGVVLPASDLSKITRVLASIEVEIQ